MSVLGPRLFAIMTSDLPECTKAGKIEIFANNAEAYCVHLICNLQKMLDDIAIWCRQSFLSIHPDKTEIMFIQKKQFIGPVRPVWLNEKQIKIVDKTECLGIAIDRNLNWKPQIRKVCKNLIGKLKFLKKLRSMSAKVQEEIYFKGLLPSATYGISVWGSCNLSSIAEL